MSLRRMALKRAARERRRPPHGHRATRSVTRFVGPDGRRYVLIRSNTPFGFFA